MKQKYFQSINNNSAQRPSKCICTIKVHLILTLIEGTDVETYLSRIG